MGTTSPTLVKLTGLLVAAAAACGAENVPFLGCETTGQVSFTPPKAGTRDIAGVPAAIASRLAYYAFSDQGGIGGGALAPRGWHCIAWLGSSGATLIVSPSKVDGWNLPKGPAVVIRWNAGSGRFQTGEIIAHAFPQYRDRLRDHKEDFGVTYQFGQYTGDIVTRRTPNLVEFQTAANRKGLGNLSGLPISGAKTYGVAILLDKNAQDSVLLTVRPSDGDQSLAQAIIRQTVRESDPRRSR